jgi:hypothetical protein
MHGSHSQTGETKTDIINWLELRHDSHSLSEEPRAVVISRLEVL